MPWDPTKPQVGDNILQSIMQIQENFAALDAHLNDTNNPHQVTAAQVGAPTQAAFDAHVADTNNPHNVQAPQVPYSSGVAGFSPADVKAALDALAGVRIVEMGSNSNGHYVRWENGLQVCWLPRLTLTTQLANQARAVWTFPAAFVNTNYSVHITQAWAVGDTPADKVTMAFSQSRSTSNCMPSLASKDYDLAGGESWGVHLVAIGRWK